MNEQPITHLEKGNSIFLIRGEKVVACAFAPHLKSRLKGFTYSQLDRYWNSIWVPRCERKAFNRWLREKGVIKA